ncbi:MAG: caspase family protein [Fuerstiella sp.]
MHSKFGLIAVLVATLAMPSFGAFAAAQSVVPPPPPVDGPGDPPLLPAYLNGKPPVMAGPPGVPEIGIGGAGNPSPLAPAELAPAVGIQNRPQQLALFQEIERRPELVIEAGGFLGAVSAIAISPNNRLVAACGGKVVYIIDADTGRKIRVLRGQQLRTSLGNTNCAIFSPDGRHLLVGVHDDGVHGSIRIYDVKDFSRIDSLLPGMNSPCVKLTFSSDGKWLASADANGNLQIWDWGQRQIVRRIPVSDPTQPIVDHLEFVSRQSHLLAIYADGPHVYQIPDGRQLNSQDQIPPMVLSWMYGLLQKQVPWPATMKAVPRTYALSFDAGTWLAAGIGQRFGKSKPWVGIWNASDRLLPAGQKTAGPKQVYEGHRWGVTCVALSSNGRFAASGDKFGEVHLWDTVTAKLKHRFVAEGKPVYQAAFTEAADRIVFGLQPDFDHWTFNQYGLNSHELDLNEQTIRPQANAQVLNEVVSANGSTISVKAGTSSQPNSRIRLTTAGRTSEYKMPTGRLPACYTLIEQTALGVNQPVLYSDNLGFLAMWDPSGTELKRAYRGHDSMVTSISVASNGKLFVTGSTDRTMRIWSLLNHSSTGIFDFRYENSNVVEVIPGSAASLAGVAVGDKIVSLDGLSLDQMYRLMLYGQFPYLPGQTVPVTLERNRQAYTVNLPLVDGFDYVEPLISVYMGDRNQWIMWTAQGYYDCSPGADSLIGWHVNRGPDKAADFYQVQQFRKQFYRPDVIRQVLKTGDFDLAAKEVDAVAPSMTGRHGQTAELDLQDPDVFSNTVPPTVKITSPTKTESTDGDRIFVEAIVTSNNQLPITEVTLLHNGTPAKVFRPRDEKRQQRFEISHRLKLFPGQNQISLIAANAKSTSNAESSAVVVTSTTATKKQKVWVLAIGISDYQSAGDELKNLQFATADAQAFADSVQQHTSGKLYADVQTKVLLNEQAGRAEILDGLQWLVDHVQPGDVAMLFCSAHGFLDDKDQFYLGTHEVQPARLRATAVPWREVTGILHEELPACQRLVFLDSCHAEGIRPLTASAALHDLAAPEMGTVFYASCTMKQKSFEREEWRHGAFTKAILDVLADRSADVFPKTGDGLLSHIELELGVVDRVSTMTGNRQNPVVYAPQQLRRNNVFEFRDPE